MRTVVAVLRGGPSLYADLSLKSGRTVLSALNPDRYETRDIFISPDGFWHRGGTSLQPERALRGSDLIINCISGRFGQDGWLHQLIAKMGHRVLGSRPGPLALSFNKEKSKLIAMRLGLQAPQHRSISADDDLDEKAFYLFRTFPMPASVSPVGGSFLYNQAIAADRDSLRAALAEALTHAPKALVEEHITGDTLSIAIVEGLRGEPLYTIPLYDNSTTAESALLIEAARRMHEALGLSHFSQSGFSVNSRGIWYQHTNALPPLHEKSPFMRGLASHEIALPEFLDHVIGLNLES